MVTVDDGELFAYLEAMPVEVGRFQYFIHLDLCMGFRHKLNLPEAAIVKNVLIRDNRYYLCEEGRLKAAIEAEARQVEFCRTVILRRRLGGKHGRYGWICLRESEIAQMANYFEPIKEKVSK